MSLNPGDKLKAKCPKCENGCSECENGYIEVSFGSKDMVMWILMCNDCGEDANGGGFDKPEEYDVNDISKYAVCPHCGSHNLRKELV